MEDGSILKVAVQDWQGKEVGRLLLEYPCVSGNDKVGLTAQEDEQTRNDEDGNYIELTAEAAETLGHALLQAASLIRQAKVLRSIGNPPAL